MTEPSRFPPPTSWWDRLAVSGEWEDYEGMPVYAAVWQDPTPAARAKLREALRLIGHFAPAQFDRLRRTVRGIIIARLHTAYASWRPRLQSCLLDIDYLESDEASSASAAATIIHELTHARLGALGFSYTRQRRARIEHICHKAERRFLTLLPESSDRAAALEAVAERLGFDASLWSDDAIRVREERLPWYIRALRFVFRPLPALDD